MSAAGQDPAPSGWLRYWPPRCVLLGVRIGCRWLDRRGDAQYIVRVSSATPVAVVTPPARSQSANYDPTSLVLSCGCGRTITTRSPLAQGARYICVSCSSSRNEKARLTRIRNEERNTVLRQRLEAFLNLPLDGHEREWFELAQELKVDPVALEALVAVVQQENWQKSTAPLMYLRINVRRRGEKWQDPFTEDGRLQHVQVFSPLPTRQDRAWLKCWSSFQEQNARVTPEDIEAASRTLSIIQDEEERAVLCARALGLTRAQYLSGVSESERRKRSAAWKRLGRHGIPCELRKALRRASGHNAIIRPGFEDRAWRDSQDDGRQELPSKSTRVPRLDF
jgi:hypothetical protein